MGKPTGMLAGLLVAALGSGAAAQDSPPEPPPWFGGRVELPEHGVAVTFPDDLVAFDLTEDIGAQVEAAYGVPAPDTVAWLQARAPADGAREGEVLVAYSQSSVCALSVLPAWASLQDPLGRDALMAVVSQQACLTSHEDMVTVDLPAGPAVVAHIEDACWGQHRERTLYSIVSGDRAARLTCDTSDPPDDDWLSIAETVEFLLEEGAEPPPWVGGQRVEMAALGFAVTVPEDWVAFDLAADIVGQSEAASQVVDPAAWSADAAGLSMVLAYAASEGHQLELINATGGDICAVMNHRGVAVQVDAIAEIAYGRYVDSPDARDVEPPQRIDLPAGPASFVRVSERAEPGADAWVPLSMWYLRGADGDVLAVVCSTDATAGLDEDWLAIAESIELLPAEE